MIVFRVSAETGIVMARTQRHLKLALFAKSDSDYSCSTLDPRVDPAPDSNNYYYEDTWPIESETACYF